MSRAVSLLMPSLNRTGWLLLAVWMLIPLASHAQTPGERLTKLFDDEWEYTLREAPTFASHLGDKRYGDRWPDVSLAAIVRRHEHQREVLKTLDGFDETKLDAVERLNYRLFRRQVEVDVEEFQFNWHLVPLDHRNGIQD